MGCLPLPRADYELALRPEREGREHVVDGTETVRHRYGEPPSPARLDGTVVRRRGRTRPKAESARRCWHEALRRSEPT
ncbi:hypothetical protein B7486_75845 [cyanobacterium TDX16]|nr:hypothetical protein B7486_75845 [cyanobacterium TDX16]